MLGGQVQGRGLDTQQRRVGDQLHTGRLSSLDDVGVLRHALADLAAGDLRNGWYWENYASAIAPAREYGKMFGAAGTARVNGASRSSTV
jgi:hypothetical protein